MKRLIVIPLFVLLLAAPAGVVVAQEASGFEALDANLAGVFETDGVTRALVSINWPGAPGGRRDVLLGRGDLLAGFTLRDIDGDRVVFGEGGAEHALQLAGTRRISSDRGVKVYTTAYHGDNDFHRESRRIQPNKIAADARRQMALASGRRPDFIRPMKGGWISSGFGLRRRPKVSGGWGSRLHQGVDIAAPAGTTVRASAEGRVTASGFGMAKGHYVVVQHSGGYTSHYFHLSRRYVSRGQYVTQGQRIGSEGQTGNSTGPHLHFQIEKNGQPLDPGIFLPSLRKR